jgi:polyferredoxin
MFWIKHRRLILWVLYALFFLHAYLWYALGYQRVGQFGFGEIFLTLKTGIFTAGTIFVLVVFIHALFFGGLFCGWFCHWGVTQDVFAWIMEKCGIKPVMRHLDSKYIQWTWFIILIFQVIFYWWFNGFPTTVEFNPSYTEVWAGNPKAILMICMTCIISGFVLIFLFGERAFCRSICTFRLWFSWFDMIAPYRIRKTKECSACSNECTDSCFMDVNVAKEIKINGVINNSACVKCFKCMGACPHNVLISSFNNGENEKDEIIEKSAPQFDRLSSVIQAAIAIIVLHFFGFTIGGNMSLSSGLIIGFILVHVWNTKSISLFEILLLLLCPVGLYYGNDMNPVTSLIKGLLAITIFILVAKYIGFKKGFEFISEMPGKNNTSKVLAVIVLLVAIGAGGMEAAASYNLQKAMAAASQKDWKTYADVLEKWGDYHNDKRSVFFNLGKVQLLNLNRYDESLESFKKSLDLSYREDLAVQTAQIYLEQGLPKHAKNLIGFLIEKGHDSPALKDLLAQAESELEAKKAAILGR